MHTKTLALAAGLAAALAGCGGSGSSTTSAAHHRLPPPTHVYRVTLRPRSPATKPATGTGVAIVALHAGVGDVCWRFAHLHGFTGARSGVIIAPRAVIHLSTSSKLHHQGCRRLSANLLAAIAAKPERYTVAIPTATSPKGAISGRL
jgi:hypothetical protein